MILIAAKLLISIELPIKIKNGNDGRGYSFWKAKKFRDDYEAELRVLGHLYDPLDFPVYLRVVRLYSGNESEWDYSSILKGTWKELEDSLVACGWFVDDGPQWILGVVADQKKSDHSGTLIEIFDGRDEIRRRELRGGLGDVKSGYLCS